MTARRLVLLLLFAWCGGLSEVSAQEVVCPVTTEPVDAAVRTPDVTIRASARAEEVRFRSEPRIEVRLSGCPVADSVRVTERRNLPEPVQPNVSYRDVFIEVEILSHLSAECLLPGLGSSAVGAASDSLPSRTASVLAHLCRSAASDSAARSTPRK